MSAPARRRAAGVHTTGTQMGSRRRSAAHSADRPVVLDVSTTLANCLAVSLHAWGAADGWGVFGGDEKRT